MEAVEKVFTYVDDYFILLKQECDGVVIENISTIFTDCRSGLVFTTDLPVSGRLRFLDLNLQVGLEHSYCLYSP